MTDCPTALYRLYDADDRLLYVGIAIEPEVRWRQHAADKPWWPKVVRREAEWHATREAADDAETVAIQAERPAYNVAKSLDRKWGDAKKPRPPRPRLDDYPNPTPKDLVELAALTEIWDQSEAYEAAKVKHDAARDALQEHIVYVLRERLMRPRDVERIGPYDRNHVGRLAKAAGVPPLRGSKSHA